MNKFRRPTLLEKVNNACFFTRKWNHFSLNQLLKLERIKKPNNRTHVPLSLSFLADFIMGKSSARLRRSQTSTSENKTTDGELSGKDGSNVPHSSDSETESNSSLDSGTESNISSDSTTYTGLSAIVRVLSDSLLRTELAEMEMIKAREAARLEAEKRRLEMEVELTRMVLETHLQATASLLVGEQNISPEGRKRKRSEEAEEHGESSSSTSS
ncbi:PREDICTED: uncharacterized protein At4g22160-like isoform X2 [Camelina sativa]|uniref:Uncharacterized protein At4g22160-like isoform X2 n=1 Tax=Camelina sativa TaxID=90675 RepID=A0ABM1QGZ4_CAMSA|nr:PREDICTED: uncharacterized protein At4g22160-like isoform X2 [Camelina sativa]